MLRVGGGLIPDDDEFSVETNTYINTIHFISSPSSIIS